MQPLSSQLQLDQIPTELSSLIETIAVACKDIAGRLQQGAISGVLGSAEAENVQGETQKKLDVISNDIIKNQLASMSMVKGMASEEEDFPVACNEEGEYLVLFDPNGDFKRAMGVNNVPHTFLIDTDGNIVYSHNNYTPGDEEELYQHVLDLVEQE